MLLKRKNNFGWYWWLVRMPEWGDPLQNISFGELGQSAYALGEYEGIIAVCGTTPTNKDDLVDAWVKIIWPNMLTQKAASFDYDPDNKDPHRFGETVRSCDFLNEDRVVLVGEVYGEHNNKKDILYNRRFEIYYDIGADMTPIHVTGPENVLEQSAATGVHVDDSGRVIITGYACDLSCTPAQGRLWEQDAEGKFVSQTALSVHSFPLLAPRAVSWHPADYVIVASGGGLGAEAFRLTAYTPGNPDPIYTYSHDSGNIFTVALDVALSPYGAVCGAGIGQSVFPAIGCTGS